MFEGEVDEANGMISLINLFLNYHSSSSTTPVGLRSHIR